MGLWNPGLKIPEGPKGARDHCDPSRVPADSGSLSSHCHLTGTEGTRRERGPRMLRPRAHGLPGRRDQEQPAGGGSEEPSRPRGGYGAVTCPPNSAHPFLPLPPAALWLSPAVTSPNALCPQALVAGFFLASCLKSLIHFELTFASGHETRVQFHSSTSGRAVFSGPPTEKAALAGGALAAD